MGCARWRMVCGGFAVALAQVASAACGGDAEPTDPTEALNTSEIFRFVEEDRRLLEGWDRSCDEVGSSVRVVESDGPHDLDVRALRRVAEAEGWKVERVDAEVNTIMFEREVGASLQTMFVSTEVSRELGGVWTIRAVGSC